MRGNTSRAILAGLVAPIVLVLCGCYFDSLGGGNTTQATLSVSMKQPVGTVTSIALVVSGPGMASIARALPVADTEVSLEVPAGADRTFTVLVNTADMSFKGETTVDLVAGESAAVSVRPVLAATELVFPDFTNNFGNSKLLQIRDIGDTSFQELFGSGIAGIGFADAQFKPYDVDFDDRGRIYIANNYGGSGMGVNAVIRTDDITGAGGLKFTELEYDYGVNSLAVDRPRSLVYFSTTAFMSTPSALHRCNLDGGSMTTLATIAGVEPIQTIRGMAVDENGILYIVGTNSLGQPRVFRYDPVGQSVLSTYSGNLNDPWDVLYKSPYVYVANNNGADNYKIIRVNADLSSPVGYGQDAGDDTLPDTAPGMFYGPRRFVAVLNRKITIIDDHNVERLDKLVSMDDITGAGWQTLPVSGNGQSLFTFYYTC
ncbi:MAG: hypothetical protein JW820_12245 [Spirochaetales bacterium]|nr:hypothetical protein [Spirochaetales bacterium]